MIGALIYLQLTTLKNAIRGRVLRLRQPKYFFAAAVGLAYVYFFFLRPAVVGPNPLPGVSHNPVAGRDWTGLFEPAAGLFLAVAMGLAWVLPGRRAALAFTEAEIAFLFPAPVSRRTLVHFKLIKSQLGILFSSLVLTVVSNRWAIGGGNVATHAAGWWLIFSIYNLHLIGASFGRERLLAWGVDARHRQVIGVVVLALLGVGTWFVLMRTLPPLARADIATPQALVNYVEKILRAPPLVWVLWPFRLIVRPFLADNLMVFLFSLWPGLLLLIGHYFWVIRSDVAFEEASVALAQKRAERLAAVQAGRWGGGAPAKRRREPFALAAQGIPCVAFSWNSMIAAGPLYYPKNWLILGLVLAGAVIWVGLTPVYQHVLVLLGVVFGAAGVYGIFFGPVLIRRGAGQMLERFDLLKSYPVQGWQVVLGELLSPVTILCAFEWMVLALLVLVTALSSHGGELTPVVLGVGAVSAAFLMVPVVGLLFALNFGGMLYFPAWLGSAGQGGGIEKFGQRLIFFVGYMMVLLGALLPGVGFGAVPFLVVSRFSGLLALAVAAGSITTFVVLAGEFALVVWWLGRRFEAFDLSVELPQGF